jgi:hypothetical protein
MGRGGSVSGWTHEEAKRHTVVERLFERCRTYVPDGRACYMRLRKEDWCERCLAADRLIELGEQ